LAQREEPAIENQNSDVRSEEEQLAPLFLPDVAKDFRTRWDAEFLSKKLSNSKGRTKSETGGGRKLRHLVNV
jgi:hypothetical protein